MTFEPIVEHRFLIENDLLKYFYGKSNIDVTSGGKEAKEGLQLAVFRRPWFQFQ